MEIADVKKITLCAREGLVWIIIDYLFADVQQLQLQKCLDPLCRCAIQVLLLQAYPAIALT
jgi:hypothetical protein